MSTINKKWTAAARDMVAAIAGGKPPGTLRAVALVGVANHGADGRRYEPEGDELAKLAREAHTLPVGFWRGVAGLALAAVPYGVRGNIRLVHDQMVVRRPAWSAIRCELFGLRHVLGLLTARARGQVVLEVRECKTQTRKDSR